MGAELPRVSVFEADEMVQIQIVKKKLEDAGIACSVSNKYLVCQRGSYVCLQTNLDILQ